MAGKFHLLSSGKRTEPRLDDGYGYWRFSHAPRDDWPEGHHYAEWVRAKGGDLNQLRDSEDRVPTELHQTTWISECALEFIDQKRDGPWMLTLNPYDPHPPFIPPRSYAERFDPAAMPGPYFRDSDLDQQKRLGQVVFQTQSRRPEEFNGKECQALYYAMIALRSMSSSLALWITSTAAGQRENTAHHFHQ